MILHAKCLVSTNKYGWMHLYTLNCCCGDYVLLRASGIDKKENICSSYCRSKLRQNSLTLLWVRVRVRSHVRKRSSAYSFGCSRYTSFHSPLMSDWPDVSNTILKGLGPLPTPNHHHHYHHYKTKEKLTARHQGV